ncbi:HNH endonuclease [[Brevibacterium] frigoritolerans]|uniref:HNH endonuclease n=1 Tax=Peribacillus frigoritolerans TaxID=450367 RepID=A0A941FKJ7_9BACI|nr:HNH endonuclease [Peribacillus frigoritolerans]
MFVNRIGNLTLLGSELNITASNHPFLEKKKKYEQSIIMLTKEICQEDKWTFEEINIRVCILLALLRRYGISIIQSRGKELSIFIVGVGFNIKY